MTTRKRKSPKGRRIAKEQSLPSRILAGAGSAVARGLSRNPRTVLGIAAFSVTFSFVAANALWYQPGGHPSPFLATRDARDPNAIAGYRTGKRPEPTDVTTFRIERAPVAEPASPGSPQTFVAAPQPSSPGVQQAAPSAAGDEIGAILAGQSGPDRAVVAGIQRELAGRGLYEGADDGLMGPRTEAAILFFEEAAGLPQRGMPTPELLAVLQSQSRAQPRNAAQTASQPSALPEVAASPAQTATAPMPTPIPRQAPRSEASRSDPRPVSMASRTAAQPASAPARTRPAEKVSLRAEDPVTAAIRAAERQPNMTPPADIPGSNRQQAARRADPVPSSQMVLQIQKGLSNIAYTDVEVDGVAGSQTKAAIRRFQKHYRLPETGEPDELVLKKLKAIGAL